MIAPEIDPALFTNNEIAPALSRTIPQTDEDPSQKKDLLLIGGSGANVNNMAYALTALAAEGHALHVVDFAEPVDPPFPVARFHRVDASTGWSASAETRLASGLVGKPYISTPPESHKDQIIHLLRYAGEGLIDGVVVTKPFVMNRQERQEVGLAHHHALRARRELAQRTGNMALNPQGSPEDASLVWVHEHYQRKGAEHELYRKLGEVTARLGRLTDVVVNIQEAQGVGRPKAFGSALGDFGPHAISLAFDVSEAINKARDYTISGRPQSHVQLVRYEDAAIPDSTVATGFIVHDTRKLTDHTRRDPATGQELVTDVNFTLMAGKGLITQKGITLTYVHPETQVVSTITADLKSNKLLVPDSVKDLFPRTDFTENGYRDSMLPGLNGGNPNISFQHPRQAGKVVGIVEDLEALGRQGRLRAHPRGMSLQELDEYPAAA